MRIPNARTSAMTAAVPIALATRHHSVPSQKPNAYPAPSSSGSPGRNANTICAMLANTNATRLIQPVASTQARKRGASATNASSSGP